MWIKRYFVMPEALQKVGVSTFEQAMNLRGKAFRDVPGRKTMRVELNIANKDVGVGKSYFIKQHFGVGWSEIIKNLISFKKPILGAMTEVSAIQKLTELGIPTTPLVAYGQQGCSPACFNIASLRSFVMTEDLGDIISLEELSVGWQEKPQEFKQKLMRELAQLAGKLHAAGLCHRDFYLCHFVIKKQDLDNQYLNLYLIDLHRMLQGQQVNSRAVMKDIAGFYFSAKQCGLSADDLRVFKQHYLPQSHAFWAQVETRAEVLLAKFNSEKFQKRLSAEQSALD